MDLRHQQPQPVHVRHRKQCADKLCLRPGRLDNLPPGGRGLRLGAALERREPHGRDVQGDRPPDVQI